MLTVKMQSSLSYFMANISNKNWHELDLFLCRTEWKNSPFEIEGIPSLFVNEIRSWAFNMKIKWGFNVFSRLVWLFNKKKDRNLSTGAIMESLNKQHVLEAPTAEIRTVVKKA